MTEKAAVLRHFTFRTNGTSRLQKHNGRTYTVIPVVALREKVLHCMGCVPGGEYIPEAEIQRSLMGWNGRPITIDHPVDEKGNLTSANAREVNGVVEIGKFWDVAYDDGLTGNLWIDNLVANSSDRGKKTLKQLAEEETEVSTGYSADRIEESGEFEGEKYEAWHANLLPDHLAVLPDSTGACSLQDGCGANRANQRELVANAEGESLTARVRAVEDEIWSRNKRMGEEPTSEWWWVVEVYEDVAIVRKEGALFEVGYTIADGGDIALGEMSEVRVEYVPVNANLARRVSRAIATLVGKQDSRRPIERQSHEEISMDRKKILAELVANTKVPFDQATLEKLKDEQLQSLHESYGCGCGGSKNEPKGNGEPAAPPAATATVAPTKEQVLAVLGLKEEDLAAFQKLTAEGASLESVLAESKALAANRASEKEQLVESLTKDSRCHLSEAGLKALSIEDLQAMANGLSASYFAAGGVRGTSASDREETTVKVLGLADVAALKSNGSRKDGE